MHALVYIISYPLVFLIANSPMSLVYLFSDFLYIVIYRIVGYRKDVVIENLTNSFPDKTENEIKSIASGYYAYMCDLLLEGLKTVWWDEKYVRDRVVMHNADLLDQLYDEGKSVVLVMGHLGNWEWAGPCFTLNCKHQLNVVYQPLSNPYFEKMFCKARTKFGTKIIKRKDTLRTMIAERKELSATAFIADQAPTPVNTAIWIDFLNQDTPVFNGPEKVAKKLDYAVVHIFIERVARGRYEIHPELITDNPKEFGEDEITKIFFAKLEEAIKKKPETWLWSHRRWKHKREKS